MEYAQNYIKITSKSNNNCGNKSLTSPVLTSPAKNNMITNDNRFNNNDDNNENENYNDSFRKNSIFNFNSSNIDSTNKKPDKTQELIKSEMESLKSQLITSIHQELQQKFCLMEQTIDGKLLLLENRILMIENLLVLKKIK